MQAFHAFVFPLPLRTAVAVHGATTAGALVVSLVKCQHHVGVCPAGDAAMAHLAGRLRSLLGPLPTTGHSRWPRPMLPPAVASCVLLNGAAQLASFVVCMHLLGRAELRRRLAFVRHVGLSSDLGPESVLAEFALLRGGRRAPPSWVEAVSTTVVEVMVTLLLCWQLLDAALF